MTTIVSTSTTSAITLADNEDLTVLAGVSVSDASDDGIVATLTGHTLQIFGQVFGSIRGIDMGGAQNAAIFVASGGTVSGATAGIGGNGTNNSVINHGTISGGIAGIQHFPDETFSVQNYGTIIGQSNFGVSMRSSTPNYNYGDITGAGGGVEIGTLGAATFFVNYGSITGVNGVGFDGDSSDPDTLFNRGTINGGIILEGGADTYNGYGGGIVNGTIDTGPGDDTIHVEQDDAVIDGGADTDILFARSDVLDVVNVETIVLQGSGNFSVLASDGAELIQGNLGNNLLQGEGGNDTISGGGGNDEIEGGAGLDEITGNTGDDLINAGADNDTVSGGAGSDTILGAAGEDELNGGAANDVIDGGDNNDTLIGFSGDDTLLGGGGSDLLVGQDGNDSLDGGIASDVLDGGLGNDILLGGSGSDVLRGRAGNDSLDGGQGLDFLTGGPGADSFIFGDATELTTGADRDQIIDFEQDLDVIDLASLIDGPLAFVGTGPFTAANQVRLIETGTGSTIVQINLDANLGTVEGEIRVADVIGLTADDFAL
jgi:Ca2+-binding RTX toxin-like protein